MTLSKTNEYFLSRSNETVVTTTKNARRMAIVHDKHYTDFLIQLPLMKWSGVETGTRLGSERVGMMGILVFRGEGGNDGNFGFPPLRLPCWFVLFRLPRFLSLPLPPPPLPPPSPLSLSSSLLGSPLAGCVSVITIGSSTCHGGR